MKHTKCESCKTAPATVSERLHYYCAPCWLKMNKPKNKKGYIDAAEKAGRWDALREAQNSTLGHN